MILINLLFTFFACFGLNAAAQKEFLGTWQSEDSKYIMTVYEFDNEFKIVNYYSENNLNADANFIFEIEYADEIILNYKKGKLYTKVNNAYTDWEINVLYTLKSKNKINAHFLNSKYNDIIHYKKIKKYQF
ncbi:MAG: hypothetical protein O2993_06445 [Bacteroidetes bacterium]|nr:hypothetical protein [Bacteroidota bacterium]